MLRKTLIVIVLVAMLLPVSAAFPITAQEPQRDGASQSMLCCGSCPATPATLGPKHPLHGIQIRESEEVKGPEKDFLVSKVLQSQDVQNVLREAPLKFNPTMAIIVRHTLDTGNTLLAVSIPMEKGALIYYELANPLAERDPKGRGYKSLYKSQAMLLGFEPENETVKLISTSVNGHLVSPLPREAGVIPLGTPPCGGCYDPYNGPWEYDSAYCSSWNVSCLIGCGVTVCGFCVLHCAQCISTGNPWACANCIACVFACPACPVFFCCQQWEAMCTSCGTLP